MVALNLEMILKTFSTNQNSAHGIYDQYQVINDQTHGNPGTPGTKSKVFRNNLKMLCHPIWNWMYLGDMKNERNMIPAEQGMWAPIKGDLTSTLNLGRNSSHIIANTKGRRLKTLLNTLELVVLKGSEKNIAEYKPHPYTHIYKTNADTI